MSPFLKGYLLACALHVWWDDYRGQAEVIRSAQENWAPWYYTSTAMALILIIAYWPTKKKEQPNAKG